LAGLTVSTGLTGGGSDEIFVEIFGEIFDEIFGVTNSFEAGPSFDGDSIFFLLTLEIEGGGGS
jgi:hypothetical protein